MKSLARRFYNETARIDAMVLMASVLGGMDSMPDVIDDDFFQEDIETMESCFGPIPEEIKEAYQSEDYSEFLGWLLDNDRFGFLLKFATPIRDSSGTFFSWGYYTMKWVYGDTMDEALEKGFAWVAGQREKEKSKA